MTTTLRRPLAAFARTVAVLFHLSALVVISVSTLLAPPWAVVVGLVVWLCSSAPLLRALRARPMTTPLVTLAVLAAWVVFLTFGDLVLGWTA